MSSVTLDNTFLFIQSQLAIELKIRDGQISFSALLFFQVRIGSLMKLINISVPRPVVALALRKETSALQALATHCSHRIRQQERVRERDSCWPWIDGHYRSYSMYVLVNRHYETGRLKSYRISFLKLFVLKDDYWDVTVASRETNLLITHPHCHLFSTLSVERYHPGGRDGEMVPAARFGFSSLR